MNSTKLEMCMSLGRDDESYGLHCMKICSLVSTSASPHRQWIGVLEKNLCRYSPIGACPSIMRVNLAHMEFDIPMCGNHDPPLEYVGFKTFSLSSSNSRNSWPFFLLSLNDCCHDSSIRSHSFFLLNKNEFFSGRMGVVWAVLVSLSTKMCLGHSSLLGQCQKCIELRPSLLRKLCIFSAMGMCKALDRGWVTLILNPLFIGDWQRELVRVLAELCMLLIHARLFVLIYWSDYIT